jgi:hypothetical protein
MTSWPQFNETKPDQIIHEIAMPLIGIRQGGDAYVAGSAFVMAPGWAITASHVVEEFVAHYDNQRIVEGNLDVSFQMLAFLTLDAGTRHLPLRILRVWTSRPLDLALLAFGVPSDLPVDHRWKIPTLQMLPPKVGTEIVGFGFANSRVNAGSSVLTQIDLDPRSGTGTVLEIHHEIRDKVRLPFPCFRTNARFDGGMSGDPVLDNSTGKVCGVVCSSLPATRDDEDHISYVSTLWPMAGIPVDVTDSGPSGGLPIPLFHLVGAGRLPRPIDWSQVSLRLASDGRQVVSARYSAAEWDGIGPESSSS